MRLREFDQAAQQGSEDALVLFAEYRFVEIIDHLEKLHVLIVDGMDLQTECDVPGQRWHGFLRRTQGGYYPGNEVNFVGWPSQAVRDGPGEGFVSSSVPARSASKGVERNPC